MNGASTATADDIFSVEYFESHAHLLDKFVVAKAPAKHSDKPVVFSIMRDEDYFLPYFIEHYRKLGIEEFWIYADRCSPEMLAKLQSHDDVGIITGPFLFSDTFGRRSNGNKIRFPDFIKAVFARSFFRNRWTLTVDADEFLVLPPPYKTIDQLADKLTSVGQNHCFAPMVDFYPRRLADLEGATGTPFQVSPFFDQGPYHKHSIGKQPLSLTGGVRERLQAFLSHHYPYEVTQIFGTMAAIYPANYKVPLVYRDGDISTDTHWINQPVNPSHFCCLAHFKFYPDMGKKVATALNEQQYYNGSMHYNVFDMALKRHPDLNLLWPKSVKYQGKKSLVDAHVLSAS